VLWLPPTASVPPIEDSRWGAEQRARTTDIAILAVAQNGTSGALGPSRHSLSNLTVGRRS